MKNATLIYNPCAGARPGRRSSEVQGAAAALQNAGIRVKLVPTSGIGNATELARAACDAGSDLIVVYGGDGTVNEVINGIAPGNIPLAILPGGTANIAAREMGIPGRIVSAARQIPQWSPHRVALGRATWHDSGALRERYFLAVAGMGFDASIIPRVRLHSKLRIGMIIYGWEAVQQALQNNFPSFRCSINGAHYPATFAVLQRTRHYAGWLRLAPGRGLREPGLACCFFRGCDRRRYLLYGLTVLTRTHSWLRDVTQIENCTTVRADADPETPVSFELDGELAGSLPASFEIVPDALTLLAP